MRKIKRETGMKKRKIIVGFEYDNLDEFRKYAMASKRIGATHVLVSQTPRSRWMWERDLKDPYPNWSMHHTPLFKLVCPPQLREFLPLDHIKECFDLVKSRCCILEELGLKPAINSNEPFWLPEEVYREHPKWRGARCDHPRRSRHAYYSPNIDNDEVLDMYTYAMKVLVEELHADYFSFMTNDSGGGLPWSNGTYVGPNGPAATRNYSMSERVLKFLDAMDRGARMAGEEITINFSANIGFKLSEEGVAEAWRGAKDNYIIHNRNSKGEHVLEYIWAENSNWLKGIPNLISLAHSLGEAMKNEKEVIFFTLQKTDLEENWKYLEKMMPDLPHSWADCMNGVTEVANMLVGAENGRLLAEALYEIHEGKLHASHDGLGLIMYGIVHQRWINRPFVLFPDQLSEEETSYYRPFQFQALDEKHANDLLDMQNIECARGFSAAFLLSESLKKAITCMRKAIALLEELKGSTDPEKKISMLIRRLKVYCCLMQTCINASRFQTLADDLDYNAEIPQSCKWPTRGDMRIEEFQNITRSEIDNAYELSDLVKGYEKMLFQIADKENEDIFVFGPDLASQIRRKAEIMLDHELDAAKVIEVHNI